MSMTRGEAIKYGENKLTLLRALGYNNYYTPGEYIGYYDEFSFVTAALSALRPITREQVVLCKDCQYWQGNNDGYPHPECRWGHDETPDEDDYCSFAERLEVNEDD